MWKSDADLTLAELLDANARFALGGRGTTNHCPMALVALRRMGASPARLRAFFDYWTRTYALDAPPVDTVIARRDWARHLGDAKAFGALRAVFLDWIAEDGAPPVLVAVMRDIPFAPASGAFHALIRLAYGLEAGHAGEIASGLAALVAGHLPLDVALDGVPRADSVGAAFEQAARAMGEAGVQGEMITSRLRKVGDDARFRQAVLAPPPSASLIDAIAAATLDAYWRTPDFTILHTVTATHAARTVFARLPKVQVAALLPPLWVALCAAYASVRRPARSEASALDLDLDLEWHEICRMAVESDDDHVIKMTYTCLCEDQRRPSPLYRAAATRLVRRDQARRLAKVSA
ncbi:questin oxidase family protein [Burkholderia sp. FERM BP-3421]|uniref:questin oxidase family protein n=1 Tax=Burkholderia sp. FERM BP-3421 TaxID=1494466 RepID=UPI00236197B0|nr:questin oxidase family protein [Burkholderia sp. FERM BP-3421]WDD90864.1 questin oxidase family protein [Burkholderia sp. FERM BP-3421]